MRKFVSRGCKVILDISGYNRVDTAEYCEKHGVYFGLPTGQLETEDFDKIKGLEHFIGQVGPNLQCEFDTGKAMGE